MNVNPASNSALLPASIIQEDSCVLVEEDIKLHRMDRHAKVMKLFTSNFTINELK